MSDESPSATYHVHDDLAAVNRFNKAMIRWHWIDWTREAFFEGFRMVVLALILYLIATIAVSGGVRELVFWFFGAGLLFAIGRVAYHILISLERAASKKERDTWTCQISDEAWSFRDHYGVLISIPWRAMKLKFEHPDGWLIEYARTSVMVHRKPLRDAGLEDTFMSRIPRQ